MELAPIVLFVYNRPLHTRQTVESLQKNTLAKESELFIFSDGPKSENDKKDVQAVREYIKEVRDFKSVTIFEREQNLGLAQSIMTGVTETISKYGKIIVLEDDLVVSPYFLSFMNNALNRYETNKRVFSITGYNYPRNLLKIPKNYKCTTYFGYRCSSWGWATWKDRWSIIDFEIKDFMDFIKDEKKMKIFKKGGDDLVDMLKDQVEGRIHSWAIKFCYSHFKHNAFCLYPMYSLVKNIGLDGSGINCVKSNRFDVIPQDTPFEIIYPEEIKVNPIIEREFRKIFKCSIKNKLSKLILR